MEQIRIGIVGYGNLGRGVEYALENAEDMVLSGVFTRRDPQSLSVRTNVPVYSLEQAARMRDSFDVMILCGGSANDLPEQTVQFAQDFNVVDSFDTHAKIPAHFAAVDQACRANGRLAIISAGWDPGMFSLNRLYGQAILPNGADYTFWGPGVSQGHSDAIRRIDGVLDARQYTVPSEAALERVRSAQQPILTTREKHTRVCYVVAKDGADLQAIEKAVKTMPNYFADYDTTVHFISREELLEKHAGIPHGGVVFRTGATGENGKNRHVIEYRLQLDSNPEFTSGVLAACARAAFRMYSEGQSGCKTLFDVPPAYLHPASGDALRRNLL